MEKHIDFERHNDEVKEVWEAYYARRPVRVPVIFGINARYLLLDPRLNPEGITFAEYSADPDVMLDVELRFAEWVRFNVPQDREMGLPEAWDVGVDFQNYYEAGFLGAEVAYPQGNVPMSRPFLNDDNKRMLLDAGVSDIEESQLWQRGMGYYRHFVELKEKGFEFRGRPLGTITPRGANTDGPLTLLMSIRGEAGLVDMYVDEEYFREMMELLTEFEIGMMRTTRREAGLPEKNESFDVADDSIELISVEDYRRFVLPYHRKIFEAMGGAGPHSMHICGDVQRHFPMLIEELGVRSFDTGFPIDWETLRDEVGEDVEISGGVHVATLLSGTAEKVREETRRILESGIMRGGRFVIREANNLAPLTPVANLTAMYEATRECGRY